MFFRSLRSSALVALTAVAGAGPAAADQVRGVRVTVTAQNPVTFQAAVNITGYTDGHGVAGSVTDLGISVRGVSIPGIQWGDGATSARPPLAFVNNSGPSGTAVYRASFTHTYPDATQRTITPAFGSAVGYTFSAGNTVVTGNPIPSTSQASYIVGVTNTVQAFVPVAAPLITRTIGVGESPAHGQVGAPLVIFTQGLSAPVRVFFSDGLNPTVEATEILADVPRGVVAARIPVGAQTGSMKVTAGGVDSLPYFFRIDPGTFTQGTDVVSGTVTSAGGPVAGAFVVLLRPTVCGILAVWDITATDPNGGYTLRGVPGDYFVHPFNPLGAGLANRGVGVTLGGGPQTLDLVMTSGTTVSGRVVRSDAPGTGVGEARLEFNSDSAIETLFTDTVGNFSVHLSPGDVRLDVDPPTGERLAAVHERPLTVVAAASQTVPDIPLNGGVMLSGFVRRMADGSPVSGANLQARPRDTCCAPTDRKRSAGDGAFSLVLLPNLTYRLEVTVDNDQPFTDVFLDGIVVAETDLTRDFDLRDAGFITGAVVDRPAGSPIANLSVQANMFPISNLPTVAFTRTCQDGSYRLRVPPSLIGYLAKAGFAEDRGYVSVTWNNTLDGTFYECEGLAVPVPTAGTEVSGIGFRLPASAAAITGSVFSQASGCTVPLGSHQQVSIDDGADHGCGLGATDFNAPGGTYRMYGLPDSTFVPALRACVNIPDTSPQCYNLRQPPAYDPIVVGPGGTAGGINFCAGNAPTREITGLQVSRSGDNLVFTWDPSTDLYHHQYHLRGAVTARPTTPSGSFPTDPVFALLATTQATSVTMPLSTPYNFFLVTDAGVTGIEGPSGHYGN